MEWPLLFLKLGGRQVLGRHLTQESHAPEVATIESRQAARAQRSSELVPSPASDPRGQCEGGRSTEAGENWWMGATLGWGFSPSLAATWLWDPEQVLTHLSLFPH